MKKRNTYRFDISVPPASPALKAKNPTLYCQALARDLLARTKSTNGRAECSDLVETLHKILEDKPWKKFPLDEKERARSFSGFVELIADYKLEELLYRIGLYLSDEAEKLKAKIAGVDKRLISPGAPAGNQNAANDKTITYSVSNCFAGRATQTGNNQAYLLRRLARDFPNILKQYENGEFRSVRAAAIAAGIIKVPTPFEAACKAVAKLNETEKAELKKLL
jgi:hypothetical protein